MCDPTGPTHAHSAATPPPLLPFQYKVGLEGSVHIVNFVEWIMWRSTNHPIHHLAPWSTMYGLDVNTTLFWDDAHISTKPTISTLIMCLSSIFSLVDTCFWMVYDLLWYLIWTLQSCFSLTYSSIY